MRPIVRSVSANALLMSGASDVEQGSRLIGDIEVLKPSSTATSRATRKRSATPESGRIRSDNISPTLRRVVSADERSRHFLVRVNIDIAPRRSPLPLREDEQAKLDLAYGIDAVEARLAHDVFADVGALHRQLAHENKTEITLADRQAISPFALLPGQTEHTWTSRRSADDCSDLSEVQIRQVAEQGRIVGVISSTTDASGRSRSMNAEGRFGVPEGWQTEDALTVEPNGMRRLRTALTGPNGEAGMIERSFDGNTLYLDRAYKSTLPTRLNGVPGFARPVSTINFLTARAMHILGVTETNLTQLKVNRLQHLPTLAHLDWLRRHYPGQPLSQLIDHTTWARSYIRETAAIVDHVLHANPVIDLQGSQRWIASHPGASQRRWNFLRDESTRLMIAHLTGRELPEIDDPSVSWKEASETAKTAYKIQRCAGLDAEKASVIEKEIDTLFETRLAAIDREEISLRRRYDLPDGTEPRHLNFDVTYRTEKIAPGAADA